MMSTMFGSILILNTLVILSFLGVIGRSKSVEHPVTPSIDEMKKYILWHSFYVNPNDPRGWVPKTFGFGWTVNFRTKSKAVVFAFLLFLQLLTAVALALSV